MSQIELERDVDLSQLSTLKVGGKARRLLRVKKVGDLVAAGGLPKSTAPPLVLGSGSNILFTGDVKNQLILKIELRGREYIEADKAMVLLRVGAGEVFDEVVSDTVARGLWGLENLSAIPGTVGATPIQNVGAYGVEVSRLITAVEAFSLTQNKVFTLAGAECGFGYRESFFKTDPGRTLVVTAVTFRLSRLPLPQLDYYDLKNHFALLPPPTLRDIRQAVIDIRAKKFPDWRQLGTAGSFFKNPIVKRAVGEALRARYPELPFYEVSPELVKLPLGFILDKICGLKGYRVGNVGLYEAQALVLVNYGPATADEILKLVTHVTKRVREKTNLSIEPEVRIV